MACAGAMPFRWDLPATTRLRAFKLNMGDFEPCDHCCPQPETALSGQQGRVYAAMAAPLLLPSRHCPERTFLIWPDANCFHSCAGSGSAAHGARDRTPLDSSKDMLPLSPRHRGTPSAGTCGETMARCPPSEVSRGEV